MDFDPRRSPITWPIPSLLLLTGSLAILARLLTVGGWGGLALLPLFIAWGLLARDWRSPAWVAWLAALLVDPFPALAVLAVVLALERGLEAVLRGTLKP